MLSDVQKAKALFFDFDGTLVDSLPILRGVYFSFMKKVGQEGSEEEFQQLNGPNIDEIVKYLKERYQLTDTPSEMKEMFHQLFLGLYSNEVHFFPGVQSFLKFAKDRGYRLFVVTSAEPIMVQLVFEKYHISDILEGIISSKEFKNGKPHPEVYLRALLQADLNSDDVVAFEDSKNGVLAATRAGIYTIAFGNEHEESSSVIPVSNWKEATKLFAKDGL